MLHSYPVTAAAAHLLASATPIRTKEASDPLDMLAKKFGDHVAEVLNKLGATNQDLAGIKEQLSVIEQKAARSGSNPSNDPVASGIGSKVVNSAELQDFISRMDNLPSGKGAASIQIKATLTSATTNAAGSVGAGLVAYRDPQFVNMPNRRLTVRGLFGAPVPVTGNSVEIVREKGRNLNAGMVAEGAAKPQSDIQFELVPVPIRTIAHWTKASRQVLEDIPQLGDILEGELMYGVGLKEEEQMLNGDGTGQNLLGMIPQATAYSAAFTPANAQIIDTIGLAILQSALANLPADGIVIHPSDWMRMCLLKDVGGNYLLGWNNGGPAAAANRVLFGLPVVDTPAMTVDKFLVGAFQQAGTVYDRWQARIEVGFDSDDFTKNLVTVLCEERVALGLKRPAALIYGDFGLVP